MRSLPRRTILVLACLVACAVAASGTGFGAASTGTSSASANLVGTLSMSDPTGVATSSPVCSRAVATEDTDGCADVTYAGSPQRVLGLGALTGNDVQAGSLTWRVTTTNPTGYVVHMSNPGAAPLLRSSAGSIADMPGSPIPATAVDDATHFGVAMGDAAADGEGAVAFGGSPWITAAGQQGELFRSVPTGGMVVAQRTAPQSNDPVTATFAAASLATTPPTPGAYSGTIQLVASAL